MTKQLAGQRAIVTGSVGGLGSAVSARLMASGVEVIGVDRAPGADLCLDIGAPDALAAAISELLETRPVDIVVHCAASIVMLSMDDISTSQWDDVMAANARGTFNLLKATLPHLRSRGYGRVVAVSSIAADFGYRYPAYSASKAAVVALVRTAAVESAQYGVTVNVVSPGRIATPMAPQDSEAELARRVPIGRAATPDEVAAVVCSLLSPDMSYITGANLVCDGGMSCVFALHGLGPYPSGVSVTG